MASARFWRSAFVGACMLALGSAALAQRVFSDGVEPLPAMCSNSPLVVPAGWQVRMTPWVEAWSFPDGSPQGIFPESPGSPVPIGAEIGELRVVPFVMPDRTTIDVTWDLAQDNAAESYKARPADSMHLAFSPCPGDLRATDSEGSDPYLKSGCRQYQSGFGTLFATTHPVDPNIACPLQAGRLYFMTIAPVFPADGLELGEHTCTETTPANTGCDVMARHTTHPTPDS